MIGRGELTPGSCPEGVRGAKNLVGATPSRKGNRAIVSDELFVHDLELRRACIRFDSRCRWAKRRGVRAELGSAGAGPFGACYFREVPSVRSIALIAGGFALASCNRSLDTVQDTQASTSESDTSGAYEDLPSDTECDGEFEYHGVCFRIGSTAFDRWWQPLDLDGAPGDEIVDFFVTNGMRAMRLEGDNFELVGESQHPMEVDARGWFLAGSFDNVEGRDLVAAFAGRAGALFHLDADGSPSYQWHVEFPVLDDDSVGMSHLVAIGPNDAGQLRLVGHYDNGHSWVEGDPLAIWDAHDSLFTQTRLETGPGWLRGCVSADFDSDGALEAACVQEAGYPEGSFLVLVGHEEGDVEVFANEYIFDYLICPDRLLVADLDEDGNPDLLNWCGSRDQPNVNYSLGRGDGTFDEGQTFSLKGPVHGPPHRNWLLERRPV